jgi:hypothetical protein
MNAKGEKQRKAVYVDLLKITGKVLGYAHKAAETIKNSVVALATVTLYRD